MESLNKILKMTKIKFRTGMHVEGSIKGVHGKGQIYILGSTLFFLQNIRRGSHPKEYMYEKQTEEATKMFDKWKYGWMFRIQDNNRLSDDVVITSVAYSPEDVIAGEEKQKTDHIYQHDGYYYLGIKGRGDARRLFRRTSHPDCCGCTLFYNFCSSMSLDYSHYRYLTDEHIEQLKAMLWYEDAASKVAHVTDKQPEAKRLLERLGFVHLHSYPNAKTGNIINIYQLDRIPEKDVNTEFVENCKKILESLRERKEFNIFTIPEENKDYGDIVNVMDPEVEEILGAARQRVMTSRGVIPPGVYSTGTSIMHNVRGSFSR